METQTVRIAAIHTIMEATAKRDTAVLPTAVCTKYVHPISTMGCNKFTASWRNCALGEGANVFTPFLIRSSYGVHSPANANGLVERANLPVKFQCIYYIPYFVESLGVLVNQSEEKKYRV